MGGMGLIFTPVLVRCLLGPPVLSGPVTSTSWTLRCSKTVLLEALAEEGSQTRWD